MLSTPTPPALERDAPVYRISVEPEPGEYGAHAFGRTLTTHLEGLLRIAVDPPLYRRNPSDRRACPPVQSYEFTVASRTLLVTVFEQSAPLGRTGLPAYALTVDGRPVPFAPSGHDQIEWQLARAVWIALTDQQATQPEAGRP